MQEQSIVGGASSSPTASGKAGVTAYSVREQDAPATLSASSFPLWEYFNPMTELDIRTGGDLPHWEQGSVWYFVTFRLADALPRAVVDEMKEERERWKRTHDLKNLSRDELAEYHRLFSERYENLLNAGSGSCVLRDPKNADIVNGALRFFEGQRYILDDYVVMPNHVHILVKPLTGHGLADILHSWKSFTANRINRQMGREGQFWQHESYDHIVRNESAMQAIRRYIRENPKKREHGIVGGASSSPTAQGKAGVACREVREQEAPATLGASSSCMAPVGAAVAGVSRGVREQDAPATLEKMTL
jgi:REP element-mobilizing transposase RayT